MLALSAAAAPARLIRQDCCFVFAAEDTRFSGAADCFSSFHYAGRYASHRRHQSFSFAFADISSSMSFSSPAARPSAIFAYFQVFAEIFLLRFRLLLFSVFILRLAAMAGFRFQFS